MAAEIVTIVDPAAGTLAQIAVNLGFNCFRFTAMPGGRPVEVLYSHPEFLAGTQRPSGSGIPILFPFPGRIPGTSFMWDGKQYALEPGDALGNAIHGFVLRRPWRLLNASESRVVGQFHAWRDDPSLKERWPADFRITATYTLSGSTLAGDFLIDNPGETLPFGFGMHPYFRVPLGGPAADECIVRLPVSERWELDQMLPTGRRLPLTGAGELQAGRKLGGLALDDVFTGLCSDSAGQCEASLSDPSGASVRIRWNAALLRECVVYTPPHRQAICIEPLSCAPSAVVLAQRGIDAGWRVLPAGGQFTASMEITVDRSGPLAPREDIALSRLH